ncbi:MAG: RpiB/LacA/LacB family sugar-phosphate isomerase [Patescibacteria group bacterium]|nr:RpiB/LacA/LacB family sugar-phosphate isomerase [Patescibacteria group bacterium]
MIYIATDHAGFELKNQIAEYLKSKGLEVEDCGPFSYDKDDDYPDLIYPCAAKVAGGGPEAKGIILGMSGQGEAIVANKAKGIRAVVYNCENLEIIKLSRQHNDANVLSLGAKFVSMGHLKTAIDLWLATPFEGGRHQRRIGKIAKIEQK